MRKNIKKSLTLGPQKKFSVKFTIFFKFFLCGGKIFHFLTAIFEYSLEARGKVGDFLTKNVTFKIL